MKFILTLLIASLSLLSVAQTKLSAKDIENLVAIGNLYSKNANIKAEPLAKNLDSLRTPALNNFIDAFIATRSQDSSTMNMQFQKRPSNEDMKLWYVIREIHYNHTTETKTKRPDIDIANEVLNSKIDERFLLADYYYRIQSGMGMYFNDADLSAYDFDLNKMGFHNDTEKAIFYFSIMELIRGRFMVLQHLKKNQAIADYGKKMPRINGRPYYEFQNFDFEEFEYTGYEKTEPYKKQHLDQMMNTLMIHFVAVMGINDKATTQELYYNSMMYNPQFFKYGGAEDTLQTLYSKWKK